MENYCYSRVTPEKLKAPPEIGGGLAITGAPDKIRTRNPQIRSLMLYPFELPALVFLPPRIIAEGRRKQNPYLGEALFTPENLLFFCLV